MSLLFFFSPMFLCEGTCKILGDHFIVVEVDWELGLNRWLWGLFLFFFLAGGGRARRRVAKGWFWVTSGAGKIGGKYLMKLYSKNTCSNHIPSDQMSFKGI